MSEVNRSQALVPASEAVVVHEEHSETEQVCPTCGGHGLRQRQSTHHEDHQQPCEVRLCARVGTTTIVEEKQATIVYE